MELIKSVRNTTKQRLEIYKMSYGDYRVVFWSGKGYTTRDFESYQEALAYANKRKGLMR